MTAAVSTVSAAASRAMRDANRWRPIDGLMAVTVTCWLYSIIQVWPIPISPTVYLPPILFLLCFDQARGAMRGVCSIASFWWLAFTQAYFCVAALSTGFAYEQIATVGRSLTGMIALIALAAYAASRPERLTRLLRLVTVLLFVSLMWLVAEVAAGEPFIAWRKALYDPLYEAFLTSTKSYLVDNSRTGLTPWTHLLGYQVAAVAPLMLLPLLLQRPRWVHALAFAGLVIICLACWFSAQRAALAAVVFTIVAMGATLRGRRFLLICGVLIVSLGATAGVLGSRTWLTSSMDTNLGGKLSTRYQDEMFFRLRMQQKAITLALAHPRGLAADGLNWNDEGFWPTYKQYDVFYAEPVGVHNSYLAYALEHGYVMLIPSVGLLVAIGVTALRHLRWHRSSRSRTSLSAAAVAFAVIGLTMLVAGTHNASLLNEEAASMVMFALFLAFEVVRRRERRQGRA